MKSTRLLAIGIFASVIIAISGCSTTSINRLEGRWQLFNLNDLGDGNFNPQNPQCNDNLYIWNFEGGELTVLVYTPPTPANPNPQPIIGGRANYKTSAEFLDAVVEISDFEQSVSHPCVIPQVSNGKWTIDKIDKEAMRLGTEDQDGSNGAYVIREFSKVD